MKIISNEKLIKTRNTAGQVITISSLVVLALGLYLSFQDNLISLALLALIVGFILSQIGIFMGNRWGKSPRPDEVISASLKGLDDKYSLYHYMTGTPHLLIGPVGVWNIIPYQQGGTIIYDQKKNRWKQKGGNIYLKLFAQESLGRPDLDVNAYLSDFNKYLKKAAPDSLGKINPQTLLLFTNEKVTLQVEDAQQPAIKPEKMKDFFRRIAKSDSVDMEIIEELRSHLPTDNIVQKSK